MAVVTLITLDKVPLCSFYGVSNILLPRRPFSSSSGGPLPSCGSWIHLCLWFLLSSCIVPGFSAIVAVWWGSSPDMVCGFLSSSGELCFSNCAMAALLLYGVYLGSSLFVTWCSSLVVLRSYLNLL